MHVARSLRTPSVPGTVLLAILLSLTVSGCGSDSLEDKPEVLDFLLSARELADTWMAQTAPEENSWNWGPTVLMYGLLELADVTGDIRYSDYVLQWLRYHIAKGFFVWSDDSSAPGLCAAVLLQRRGAEVQDLWVAVDRVAYYLFNEAPRLTDGGISHMGYLPLIYRKMIWIDGLFMFGPFFIKGGELLHDPDWREEFVQQVQVFANHLRSPEDGLYTHSYSQRWDRTIPLLSHDIFWARGNSWGLYAMTLLLSSLPDGHPAKEEITGYTVGMAQAVINWQDVSGLWWTVLNYPGQGYTETAATGILTAALAAGRRMELLGETAETAAWGGMQGLKTRIVKQGEASILTGTSIGTNPGGLWYYTHVPVRDQVNYGVGGYLLAAAEMVRLYR